MIRPFRNTRLVRTATALTIATMMPLTALLPSLVSADTNTPVANSPLVVSELQTGAVPKKAS